MDESEVEGSNLALLVGRAQSGHLGSLDALLRWVQLPLYRHITALTSDDELAKDVLQSTLWTIARKIGQLRDPAVFRAWCYRIATRLALRAAKRERQWTNALRDDSLALMTDEDAKPEELFGGNSRDEVERLLAGLSGASRVVMQMYYLEDLSYAEIAEALDVPLGTVKSRIGYGLAALRRRSAP